VIPFDYHRALDTRSAVETVAAHPHATFLAGGTNLVDHMKLGLASPDLLVDVSRLPLDRVEILQDGRVRIGATMRNSDAAAHPLIRARYPALSCALLAGASAQIRNVATVGGNLLQRTRCGYFQDLTTPCNKRSPGAGCAAIGGYTRDHAILGTSPHCIATHPSDMAVALAAFDADVVVLGGHGERRVALTHLYRLPGTSPHRDTVLEHGELITGVELPAIPVARHSTYRKVRDRASYAFALVSVAAALAIEDGLITDARVALGGVAHRPWRAYTVEAELRGHPTSEKTYRRAAGAELSEALVHTGNAFKVPLVTNTLVAVLRELAWRQSGPPPAS